MKAFARNFAFGRIVNKEFISTRQSPETITWVRLCMKNESLLDRNRYPSFKMPLCTVVLSYEIYEGSLGRGPLPLLSWTIYINGLGSRLRAGMQKFYPELKDSTGKALSCSQNAYANFPSAMAVLTNYLNWLDGEGFRVMGSSMDSSTYHGGVTKTQIYTLQMQDLTVT